MGVQREEAIIDVTVNQRAAGLNFDELDAKVKRLTESLRSMHREEDPRLYDGRVRALAQATAQRDAERVAINGGAEALRNFQRDFINGNRAVEVAATNNPVKKYAIEARTAFEQLNNSINKNSLKGQLTGIKEVFSGAEAVSSPFFNYISQGFQTASAAVDNYRSKTQLQRAAMAENIVAHERLQAAMATTVAEQEAVNAALMVNRAAQAESSAAVAAATTLTEAEAAAQQHKKLVQEESLLVTRAQTLAENQATIATEQQTVALEAQTIATTQGTGAMRIFKVALASTGIGLLIVAIASLVAYFAETNEGSKKFKVLMAELNALFQECMKLLAPIGKAIFNTFSESTGPLMAFTGVVKNALLPLATMLKLFSDIKSGNFKQALIDVKEAMASWSDNTVDIGAGLWIAGKDLASNMTKAADEIKKVDTNFGGAAKSAKQVAEERQRLVDSERDWTVEKTKQIGQVDLLTKRLANQNLTEAQRLAIGEKAKAMRLEIYKTDLDFAKKNEDLVNKEQAAKAKKDLDAIAEAKKRVQEVSNIYNIQIQDINNKSIVASRVDNIAAANQAAYDKLLEMAKGFSKKAEVDRRSANDKEVAEAEKVYDDLITGLNDYIKRKGIGEKEIAKAEELILATRYNKVAEVTKIRARQEEELAAKIKEFHQQITDVHGNELQKQTDLINAKYNQWVIDAGTNADQVKMIEVARQEELNTVKLQEEERLQKEIQRIREEGATTDEDKQKVKIEKINQHYDAELEALKKNFSKKLQETQAFKDAEALILQNKDKKIKTAVDEDPKEVKKAKDALEKRKKESELEKQAAQETANTLFSISSKNRNTETNNKIRALEAQAEIELKTGRKTEKQKQEIRDRLAKEEAKVKTDAWRADQQAAIGQAIINGALAMTKVAAQTGILSFAFDPIIALKTAAEIALISSREPPVFAKGGIIDGPSHSNGGVPLIDGNTGRTIAEVEGQETVAVFSKEATKNNQWLINQLLFSSMFRNGARVDVGAIGNGVKLEKGGPLAVSAAGGNYSSTATENHHYYDQSELIAEFRLMRQAFHDQKISLSTTALADQTRKEVEIEKRAKL
ncbi:MAG: hypothetical protein V4619_07510 [Bacteroidota bacterium]